jgi:hypothetical protein
MIDADVDARDENATTAMSRIAGDLFWSRAVFPEAPRDVLFGHVVDLRAPVHR